MKHLFGLYYCDEHNFAAAFRHIRTHQSVWSDEMDESAFVQHLSHILLTYQKELLTTGSDSRRLAIISNDLFAAINYIGPTETHDIEPRYLLTFLQVCE
jgi:hypothetical protein